MVNFLGAAEDITLRGPDGETLIQTIGNIPNFWILNVSKFPDNRSHISQALSAGKSRIISDGSKQWYLDPILTT